MKTVAKSIEQYSNQLETLFLEEMFPRKPEEIIDHDVARPSAWLTKAKLVVQGDRKVEPFVFQPQVSSFSHFTFRIDNLPKSISSELRQTKQYSSC